jgi:transposase-like protein
MKQAGDLLYRRHRFPAEVILSAVWLYFQFSVSLRARRAEKFGRERTRSKRSAPGQITERARRKSEARYAERWPGSTAKVRLQQLRKARH